MGERKKYWEELVSDVYSDAGNSEHRPGQNGWDVADYNWAQSLKDRLVKVFLWDQYNKREAKLRLNYRLKHRENRLLKFSRTSWGKAAILLVAIVSGALLHSLIPQMLNEQKFTEVSVPLGQMSQIKLSDGTQIWLNSGSVVKYPNEFDQANREVFLNGEAYFEVAKDKHKPFIVNASDFDVEVLGTSFNVSSYSTDNFSNVTLVEGSVLLHSNIGHWNRNIVPGQVATVIHGDVRNVEDVNTEFYTSWKEGKIVFRKERLEQIAKKMERWYNVEIYFEKDELKDLVFSGTFLKYKPIEQVFQSLSLTSKRIDFTTINRVDEKNIITIIEKGKTKN